MKSITNFLDLHEGIIRGLANEPWALGQGILAVLDSFEVLKGLTPQQKQHKISKAFSKLKKELQNNDISFNTNQTRRLQKSLNVMGHWRQHIILNDKIYRDNIETILKGGESSNIFFNVDFKNRLTKEIFEARNTRDLIKVIEKYESRINELVNYIKKHPDNPGFDNMLTWGIFGIRDLMIVINRMYKFSM